MNFSTRTHWLQPYLILFLLLMLLLAVKAPFFLYGVLVIPILLAAARHGLAGGAVAGIATPGLMKIVIDADTDRILGAAILGSEGGELVQTLMALMMADAPRTIFEKATFIHPTLTESFFTLMDNVEEVEPKTDEEMTATDSLPEPA